MKSTEQEQTVIFLHLPRTAGTTLKSMLERQYMEEESFYISNEVIKKIGEKWRDYPYPEREKIALDTLVEMPNIHKQKLKIIQGHMNFGWHDCLVKPYKYITILRDPVERVVSLL